MNVQLITSLVFIPGVLIPGAFKLGIFIKEENSGHALGFSWEIKYAPELL